MSLPKITLTLPDGAPKEFEEHLISGWGSHDSPGGYNYIMYAGTKTKVLESGEEISKLLKK